MSQSNGQRPARFRLDDYTAGVRTGVRNNASAYGFSVLITATFGAANTMVGTPGIAQLFLFTTGASLGFLIVELAASRGFSDQVRGDRSEVVVLGSAVNLVSISAGLGAAVLIGLLLGGWLVWLLAPMVATGVYLGVNGLEMALARGAERRREHRAAEPPVDNQSGVRSAGG